MGALPSHSWLTSVYRSMKTHHNKLSVHYLMRDIQGRDTQIFRHVSGAGSSSMSRGCLAEGHTADAHSWLQHRRAFPKGTKGPARKICRYMQHRTVLTEWEIEQASQGPAKPLYLMEKNFGFLIFQRHRQGAQPHAYKAILKARRSHMRGSYISQFSSSNFTRRGLWFVMKTTASAFCLVDLHIVQSRETRSPHIKLVCQKLDERKT